MDTRFFGPSAWQLFHLIAFRSDNPTSVLQDMKDVLPCRYCRESTTQFVKDHPLDKKDPAKWLYDIHNKVNAKLRKQAEDDPSVIDPGADPEFEDVKRRYMAMKPNAVPGRDFLLAIAYNYPDEPEEDQKQVQKTFLEHLAEAYPFGRLRKVFNSYIRKQEPELSGRRAYLRWMYGLLKELSDEVGVSIRSFKGYTHHVAYYKSGCSKKTYHGKTCRRLTGGGFTKSRDTRKTHRITHRNLL